MQLLDLPAHWRDSRRRRAGTFRLETARDDLATYTFGRHVIRHQFCKTCGCAPFSEGTGPDGTAMVAVNLRCAEDLDLDTLEISRFDGASL